MKIFIPIPVWKRPEVFLDCLKGMKRFVRRSMRYQITVIPYFILSPEDYYYKLNSHLVQSFKFNWCTYENLPVGEKMNAGINLALEIIEFDYLMNCGSDNIINPEIWKIYKPLMKQERQLFGLRNFYCYGTVEDQAIYFDNYNKNRAIGTARMIHSRSIQRLKKLKIQLYDNDLDSGLDTDSGKRLLKNCNITEKVINSKYPYTLGIKSATNINPFISLMNRKEKITNVEFNDIKKYFYDK